MLLEIPQHTCTDSSCILNYVISVDVCEEEWLNGRQWRPSGLILVLQRRRRDAAETDESPEQGPNCHQLNRFFTFRFQFLDCVHWQAEQSREQWTLIHELCETQYTLGHCCWNWATQVGLLPCRTARLILFEIGTGVIAVYETWLHSKWILLVNFSLFSI